MTPITLNAPRIGLAKWASLALRLVLILLGAGLGSARANPLAAPAAAGAAVYIASEQLRVDLSERTAVVRGEFKFRRQPKSPPGIDAGGLLLDLPVWVPSAAAADKATAEVLSLFGRDQNVVFGKKDLSKIAKLLALQVTLGSRPLRVSQVFLNETLDYGTNGLACRGWPREAGFECLILRFDIARAKELEDQNLAVSYRQPNSWINGAGKFYYVPNFEGLPKDRVTTEKKSYSITLAGPTNVTLQVSAGHQHLAVPPGRAVTLSPQHEQPIHAEVKSILAKAPAAQAKNRPAQPPHPAVVLPQAKE